LGGLESSQAGTIGGFKAGPVDAVLGETGQEKGVQAIKTEFDARVTCKRGRSRVFQTYTQFT
jgi:hypothetical protein